MLSEHRKPHRPAPSCASRCVASTAADLQHKPLARRASTFDRRASVTRRLGSVSVLFIAVSLACSRSTNFVPAPQLPLPSDEAYRIQVADVLDFSFFRTPELSQSRTVGPDGEISLMLVGSVRVAGRTLAEVSETVNRMYTSELTNPQMTVSVAEYSGMSVYVAGEVNDPGMVEYRGGLTLVGAIMHAGGFLNTARLGQVVVIRRLPNGQPQASKIDVHAMLARAELAEDIPLTPSDIIFVPRSIIANIDQFVQQYFRDILPVPLFLGFDVGPVRTR